MKKVLVIPDEYEELLPSLDYKRIENVNDIIFWFANPLNLEDNEILICRTDYTQRLLDLVKSFPDFKENFKLDIVQPSIGIKSADPVFYTVLSIDELDVDNWKQDSLSVSDGDDADHELKTEQDFSIEEGDEQ